MKSTRREFLAKIGATVGAITIGKNIILRFDARAEETDPTQIQVVGGKGGDRVQVDFKYAPKDWQSTYCFPDDPYKSLVGRSGDLRYGHEGIEKDEKFFPHVISIGMKGREPLRYVDQKLESPWIPIITTSLDGGDVLVTLTTFSSKNEDEGRVDNLLVEIKSKGGLNVQCSPEIVLKSTGKFLLVSDEDYSIVQVDDTAKKAFFIVDRQAVASESDGEKRYDLPMLNVKGEKPVRFFVRFPQEGQDYDKLEDGLDEPEELLEETRLFWQNLKPTEGKVAWGLIDPYESFFTASVRNILQAREVKNGKKVFQVGPTVYRGLWVVDGLSLTEAARYLGYDREAQEGLEAMWEMQGEGGIFKAGAGEGHWKDTAVAVYALIRHAELTQNWDYFNQMYPDAFTGLMTLKDMRDKAYKDGTSNGNYRLLPKGFGDSGIGGIREEFTNTLWTLVTLKALDSVAYRINLQKRSLIKEFYGELRQAFYEAMRQEKRQHPNGFSFLPMLMKSDPRWNEKDLMKQPRFQAAQIYVSQAIFPGLLFVKDDPIVTGHIELMKAVVKEDIPAETGWLSDNAVWPYNAAIAAQAFLWLGMQDIARKFFIGFLNHASPLYAWREEQSLQSSEIFNYIGDMPHNWASAECIRYLRHMMVLEDEKNLQLFRGIGIPELKAEKAMSLTYTPTRWGRVTVTLEPVDINTWKTHFKREEFDESTMPKLDYVMMPRKLAGKYYFDKITGAKGFKEGQRSFVRAEDKEWECTWKSFS
jgi:hypothetical protein